jgi:CHAT domain-containing protein/tetratricopeptide (TPR) repeat protein
MTLRRPGRAALVIACLIFAKGVPLADVTGLDEVWRLVNAGRYAEAEGAGRALLLKVEVESGPDSLPVAEVLIPLVRSLYKGGKNAEPGTVALAARGVAIREQLLGPDHPDLAASLNVLGNVYRLNADYAKARPVLERALRISEKSAGPGDIATGVALGDLGSVAADVADYAKAREYYDRALAIAEKSDTPIRVASLLNNLATVLMDIDDSGAVPLLRRAAAIYEKEEGPDHPYLAVALNNLSGALQDAGDLEEAREAEERALRIRETRLGPDHRLVAHSLTSLASIFSALGQPERARPLVERALRIREEKLGPDDPTVAISLVGLGEIHAQMGDRAGARPLYDRALKIREARLGPEHPHVARLLIKMARLEMAEGRSRPAIDLTMRATQITRDQFLRAAPAMAEREAVNFASLVVTSLDALMDSVGGTGDRTLDLSPVWDLLVRSRALILDELARRHRTVLEVGRPEVRNRSAGLEEARGKLARLVLSGPGGPGTDITGDLRDAQEGVDRAERELARASAAFRSDQERSRGGFAEVRRALPPEAALVGLTQSGTSYLAFVLKGRRDRPRLLNLGPKETIDRLVETWQQRASAPPSVSASLASYRDAGAALRKAVWDPLLPAIGHARLVFIVPDGTLNRVSFATLPLDGDRYLVEEGPTIHYLSAERDLLGSSERRPAPAGSTGGLLALGGPDFEGSADAPAAPPHLAQVSSGEGTPSPGSQEPVFYRGALPACRDFRNLRFSPLPGARAEADEIVSLWRRAAPSAGRPADSVLELTGRDAGEGAFKRNASGRSVLHLATHGFWLQQPCDAPGAKPEGAAASATPPSKPAATAPLLLSGLALAGANHRNDPADSSKGEDGILTAEEVASLDLRSVGWVVLSACQSGVGPTLRGEGVLGLRRAFQVAGAGTLITALWPVSDQDTRDWMRELYAARLNGADTPGAVETASRRILETRRRAGAPTHPFFWGAFVAAGDWR